MTMQREDLSPRGERQKTLFGQWAMCSASSQKLAKQRITARDEEDHIERDTIVTCKINFLQQMVHDNRTQRWSATVDSKEKAKYRFAIRMVEDGALEAYEDVNLNNDTFPKSNVFKMINGNDVVGVKGKLGSSVLN